MRFIKQNIQKGKQRTRKKFLFLPKTIEGETRWLEWAIWLEEYYECDDFPPGEYSWKAIKWLNK